MSALEEIHVLPELPQTEEEEDLTYALNLATIACANAASVAKFSDMCIEKWGDDTQKWAPNCKLTTNVRKHFRHLWIPVNYVERTRPDWLLGQATTAEGQLQLITGERNPEWPADVEKFVAAAYKAADRVFQSQLDAAKAHVNTQKVRKFSFILKIKNLYMKIK